MNRQWIVNGMLGIVTWMAVSCGPAPKKPEIVLGNGSTEAVDLTRAIAPKNSAVDVIGAPVAWKWSVKKEEPVVAVIGTGVDYTIADIADSLWVNKGEYGDTRSVDHVDSDANGFTDDVIGYDFVDDDGLPYDRHGMDTLTAGLIADRGRTDPVMIGVNPRARIMALRYMNDDGRGSLYDLVMAIEYAVQQKADIMLIDLPKTDLALEDAHLFEAALEEALSHQIHVVIPAGNDRNINVPKMIDLAARFENVLVVGASTLNDTIADFSNLGRERVKMLAPGVDIEGMFPGPEKRRISGTAVSAALVAGALSLVIQADGMESYYGAREFLIRNVEQIPAMQAVTLSGGVLNVGVQR